MLLPTDTLDDQILEAGTNGFVALDETTKATLLADTALQAAKDSICRTDGIIGPRPGLRYCGRAEAHGLANGFDTQAALFFGVGGYQALLHMRAGSLSVIPDLEQGTPVNLARSYPTGPMPAAALVDRAYFAHPEGGLIWAQYASGWTTGTVTKWADSTGMPVFSALCAHGYRLLAAKAGTDEIYASTLLGGSVPADWSQTTQIRVGKGNSDPLVALLSGQDSYLLALKSSSVWRVDTSAASAGDWSTGQLTDKCGCAAARSVVQIGGDTLFLSRAGVISLSGLATVDALSEVSVISAPIDASIRRINWPAAGRVVAEAWGQYYLLALPLDADAAPRDVFAWDVVRRAWVGHWRIDLPDAAAATPGIGAMVATTFGNIPELVVLDNSGHVRRFEQTSVVDELDRVAGIATTQDVMQDLRTKSWDFGAPDNFKSLVNLVVDFWDSSSATAQIYLVRDGKDPELVAGPIRATANSQFPLGFPLSFQRDKALSRSFSLRRFGRAREVSVRIAETTGALALRRVQVSAFLDSAEVER